MTPDPLAAIALLQAPGGGGGAGLALIIQFVAIIGIFWFLLIRPQRKAQKEHQAMVAALKRGDDVMTEGGIIGQVVHIADDRVTIKTADSTRLVVARPKIQRVFRPAAETGEAK